MVAVIGAGVCVCVCVCLCSSVVVAIGAIQAKWMKIIRMYQMFSVSRRVFHLNGAFQNVKCEVIIY